jgi:hypothetical protein
MLSDDTHNAYIKGAYYVPEQPLNILSGACQFRSGVSVFLGLILSSTCVALLPFGTSLCIAKASNLPALRFLKTDGMCLPEMKKESEVKFERSPD